MQTGKSLRKRLAWWTQPFCKASNATTHKQHNTTSVRKAELSTHIYSCVMAKRPRNIFNSAGFVHYRWHWVWCVPVVAPSVVYPCSGTGCGVPVVGLGGVSMSWHWVWCPCRGTECGVSMSWHWMRCVPVVALGVMRPCRGTECGVSLSMHWMWRVPVVALDVVCPCRGTGCGVFLSWHIRQINQPFQQRY